VPVVPFPNSPPDADKRVDAAVNRPLRLLLVEDSERDAAHVALSLRRGGWAPEIRRVETREGVLAALRDGPWDVVVSDYNLPRFSAPEALELVRASGLDVPFLVVSGSIGEDVAVELMRCGANDYLLKDRLARLSSAIERELHQVSVRRAKRRAESLFQSVLRASPHPSAVIDRATGHIVDGSNSFAKQFLGGENYPVARSLFTLIDFSQPERIEQVIARGSGTAWYTVYYVAGVGRVANIHCYTVDHDGGSYAYVVIEDVTEQHYLKAAFDAIANAILVIGSDGRLLYANHPAEALFEQLYFGALVDPLLVSPTLETRWWQRPTQRFDQQRIELKGQPYEATSVSFRFAGEVEASTILTLRNIAEEEELVQLASHDALTGAFNTRHFASILPQQIEIVRGGGVSTMVLVDLDHFKPINDELGHAAGDAALIMFANIVRAELRTSDLFTRLGGDEFAIVFPHLSVDDVSRVLGRIYERMQRTPLRFDGSIRSLSASCGVTALTADDSAESVKMRADRALYEAKHQGRGRFVLAEA